MKHSDVTPVEEEYQEDPEEVSTEPAPWKPPEWEYHRMKTPDRQPVTASALNELGRLGWELVSVLHVGGEINYIFKRMK